MKKATAVRMLCACFALCLFFALPTAAAPSAEEAYGYESLSQRENSIRLQSFYRVIANAAESFENAGRDVTASEEYCFASLDYAASGLDAYEAVKVWKLFFADSPQYYWMENRVSVSQGLMHMYVYADYATAADREDLDRTLQAGIALMLAAAEGRQTQTDRAIAVHDRLLESVYYAYEEDGVTPSAAPEAHNVVGALTGRGAVCDGYAKTYALLMRELGIPCIFVDGTANGQPHAWNMICLDGVWYSVDPTWNDGGRQPLSYFGQDPELFARTHRPFTPEGEGAEHLYPLPEGGRSLALVALLSGQETVSYCAGLPQALQQLAQASGQQLWLCLYANDGAGRTYSLPACTLPQLEHVRLCAQTQEDTPLPLAVEGVVYASGALTLENILLQGAGAGAALEMGAYELTFAGNTGGGRDLRLDAQQSMLSIFVSRSFTWQGELYVNTCNAASGRVSLAGHADIAYLRVLSESVAVQLTDSDHRAMDFTLRRLYLGAPCSIALFPGCENGRLSVGTVSGGERLLLSLQIADIAHMPLIRLEENVRLAADFSIRTFTEEERVDPVTGEVTVLRMEADLSSFDGRIAYAPAAQPGTSGVFFVLPDRTVDLTAQMYVDAEGWVRVPTEPELNGAPEPEISPAPVEHLFGEYVVMREPTCSSSGESYRVCRLCGLTEYKILPVRAHVYGGFRVVRQPTAEQEGLRERYCIHCGHADGERIPTLSPTPTSAPLPTPTPVPSQPPSGPEPGDERGWTVWVLVGVCLLTAGVILLPELKSLAKRIKK